MASAARDALCAAATLLLPLFFAYPALADDPFPFTLGGRAQEWAGNGANGLVEKGIEQLSVSGSTDLDDGLKLGGEVSLRELQGIAVNHSLEDTPSPISRAYASLTSSDYGLLQLGEQANVGYLIHNSAPSVSMIGGQGHSWWSWITDPENHRGRLRSFDGDDGTSDKIVYLSPALSGLTLGVSYTPDIDNRLTISPALGNHNVGVDRWGEPRLRGDLAVEGLSYRWNDGPRWARGDFSLAEEDGGRLIVYQGGVQTGYAGWILGGSVSRREARQSDPLFKEAAADGFAWDAGLSYAIGPLSAAITIFGEASAKGNLSDRNALAGLTPAMVGYVPSTALAADRDQAASLELSYKLTRQLSINATMLHVRYRDGFGVAAEQASGWTEIAGLNFAF